MARNFQLAVDILGKPGKRDVKAYLSEMAVPAEGKADLLKIPAFIINGMFFLNRIQRALFPRSPYDTPFLPYNLRAGHKFLSEYDPDFSRATLDGDLSRDFYPEDALERVKCPMLLIWAGGHRHETWGLLGAMDDKDVACVTALVEDLHCVQIPGAHEIHMVQPGKYIDEVLKFVHTLRAGRKLP